MARQYETRWRPGLLAAAVALALLACGPKPEDLLAAARTQIAKHEYEAARAHVRTVLQKSPNNGEARLLLGQLLMETGAAADAEAELRRALEKGQSEDAVLPLLAGAMLQQGKAELLLQQYGNLELKSVPADTVFKTHLAEAYAKTNALDKADEVLDAVLKRAPDDPPATLLWARLRATGGDIEGALARVSALLQRSPGSAQAWAFKGELLQRKGDLAAAVTAWQESLKLRPAQIGVHSAVVGALLSLGDKDGAQAQWEKMQKAAPKSPQTAYYEALLAANNGNFARARELTQGLLRSAPDSPMLLTLAGEAEYRLKDMAQAEAHLAKAIQLAPKLALPRRALAELQLQQRQPAKALTTLAPLLEGKAADADALRIAGRAYLQSGDKKAADQSFAKAAQINPDDARTKAMQALSRLEQGDNKALADLEKLADEDKGSRVDLALITTKLRRGDAKGALQQVDKLAAKLPDSALPDHLRGRISAYGRDSGAARAYFEKAIAKEPNYLPSLAGLADLDLAAGKKDDARKRFDKLLDAQPNNAKAMLARAEVSLRSGDREEAQRWIEKAVKADPSSSLPRLVQVDQWMAANQPDKALNAARAAVAALPDEMPLRELLGRAEMQSGQPEQAVTTFGRLASADPRSARTQLLLAEAYRAAGDNDGAAAALRKAQELEPEALPVLQALAAQAMQQKKPDVALAQARKIQARWPKATVGFQLEGDIAAAQQQWGGAEAAYRKALALAPDSGALAVLVQVALTRAGKSADAERFAADWQKAHPADVAMAIQLADQAMARKAGDDAERRYREVLERQPQHPLALNNLAFLLCSNGKAEGLALAERALPLSTLQAPVLDTVALCQSVGGDWSKAVKTQAQAVKLAPQIAPYRLQLAKFQIKAGDKPAARDELRTLQKLGNGFAQQDEVSELLKSVGD